MPRTCAHGPTSWCRGRAPLPAFQAWNQPAIITGLAINRQRNPELTGHVHGHLELNYFLRWIRLPPRQSRSAGAGQALGAVPSGC